jgi:hypothetical protein
MKELFRDSIEDCPDIEIQSFPHLNEIKGSKALTPITKIAKQVFRCLIIFVGWLYQANKIGSILKEGYGERAFGFENFPILKDIFQCIEEHLAENK